MSVKTKSQVRSFYKEIRANFPVGEKIDFDNKIAENLFNLDVYKKCKTVLAFVSKDIEVNTESIIATAFSDGKTVAVPRCDTKSNIMTFYIIKSRDDLEAGYYGIPEPKETCAALKDFNSSICLVPALVYDKKLFRVGFGKGYYDRFLNEYSGVSVGVCYSDCITEQLPKDDFDRPVNILITDSIIYRKDKGYG